MNRLVCLFRKIDSNNSLVYCACLFSHFLITSIRQYLQKEEAILIFLGNNLMTDQDFLRHNQLLLSAQVHI